MIKKFYDKYKKEHDHIPVTGDDSDIILCVNKSIDAGFDLEDLTLLINLEYVKSKSLVIQLKGRLARTYEGKTKAVYVSMIDNGFNFIGGSRYNSIASIIVDEGKSQVMHFDSGVTLPLNISKKEKKIKSST